MEDSLHTVIMLPIRLLSEMLNQVPLKRESFRGGGANARTKKIPSVCGVCGRDFPPWEAANCRNVYLKHAETYSNEQTIFEKLSDLWK